MVVNNMKNRFLIFVLVISVVMVSCDGGPKRTGSSPRGSQTNVGLTASVTDGKIYFDYNCGGCHAAGSDDNESAFGDIVLMDLKNNQKISNNMSQFGGTFELMNGFSNLSPQRVLDLQTYLITQIYR